MPYTKGANAVAKKKPAKDVKDELNRRAQYSAIGDFSPDHVYTLEAIGAKFGRDKTWAYYAFIRPSDHHTRERRLDAEGKCVPGMFHLKIGTVYLVSGRAILDWLQEHGSVCVD